jgi:hypothetical protein
MVELVIMLRKFKVVRSWKMPLERVRVVMMV